MVRLCYIVVFLSYPSRFHSVFDIPPCPWYLIWNYSALRSGIVYIRLLQMGRTPHCRAFDGVLASNVLLYLVTQTW